MDKGQGRTRCNQQGNATDNKYFPGNHFVVNGSFQKERLRKTIIDRLFIGLVSNKGQRD